MVVVTYRLFLIPLTSPSGCSLETQTSLVAEWLSLAARRAFVGHPRRLMEGGREGGREFPGHLLAPLTYYLPQLEQRPPPAHPPLTTLPLIPMFIF